ncbi:four helix bundle protein [Lewinella marina]|uniref:Diversity-generating retroelement protein bAvd family protein n=1 Tax=Neolewinella marina TaxID=438751 RepID=A0A2G0CJX8_9BACT|nr:four helix bundle protein [Neolewinella marina]NJB84590.1 four helix bundle protein [Neolewinella marina]PHL00231.1 diversity-generating retroelement protein bAvd family protein [Neolewinella marina]
MKTSAFRAWAAYRKAFDLSLKIVNVSLRFPPHERSMADQIRRCSRSVCANLAEVHAVRSYPRHYRSKLVICIGENMETQVWLELALAAKYIQKEQYNTLLTLSEEVGRLLSYMITRHEKFAKWKC